MKIFRNSLFGLYAWTGKIEFSACDIHVTCKFLRLEIGQYSLVFHYIITAC